MATNEITDDYGRINWVNKDVGSTPLNGSTSTSTGFLDGNLNIMDYALKQHSTRLADLYNNKVEKDDIPFSFGVDSDGNYGYIKAGETDVTPFKNPTGDVKISSVGTTDVTNYATATTDGLMVIPTDSTEITANGTVDVTNYASAIVNVPGETPTGTKDITENGTYDVTDYASAVVNVPGVIPTGTKSIDITNAGVTTEDVSGYANAEITVSDISVPTNTDFTLTTSASSTDTDESNITIKNNKNRDLNVTNYASGRVSLLDFGETEYYGGTLTATATADSSSVTKQIIADGVWEQTKLTPKSDSGDYYGRISYTPPTETKTITVDTDSSFTTDVMNYKNAKIVPSGLVKPDTTLESAEFDVSESTVAYSGKVYCPNGLKVKGVTGGTLDITANGTFDVLNYASAIVNIESVSNIKYGVLFRSSSTSPKITEKASIDCGFKPDMVLYVSRYFTTAYLIFMFAYNSALPTGTTKYYYGHSSSAVTQQTIGSGRLYSIDDSGFTLNALSNVTNSTDYWVAVQFDDSVSAVSVEEE